MINFNTNFKAYPDPWDLRYFQEIAHTGNLSRAAERLGVGQPALSLSLKRLEENLGVELFLRRNRGLVLTPAGQRLLRESNKLLSAWESLVAETKKSETEIRGRFSIGAHPSVAMIVLKNILRKIYEKYPGIELQLHHDLSRKICEQVISGQIDFGLVVNPVRHPDLIIRQLYKDEVGFWKSKDALENVLLYHPALVQSQSLLNKIKKRTSLHSHSQSQSKFQYQFERSITSENLEVLAVLARSGTGVAILPEQVVKNMAPELKRLKNFPVYQDEITFIYRVDIPKSASAMSIIEIIR